MKREKNMTTRRRGNGEGSIYQRPDGRWCAQAPPKYDPLTGKEKRPTLYGKTRREVVEKLKLAQMALQQGKPVDRVSLSVKELVTTYITDEAVPHVRPKTLYLYRHCADKLIEPHLGKRRVADLTVREIEQWQTTLGKRLSSQMVKHARGVLLRAVAMAMRYDWIGRNVVALARPPKVVHKATPELTQASAVAIMEATRGQRFEAIFFILLGCGLRINEILGLTWSDIDTEKATLTVKGQLMRTNGANTGDFTIAAPKTKAAMRTVPMPEFVTESLRQHRRTMLDAIKTQSQTGEPWGNTWNLVFTTWEGKPLSDNNIRRALKLALQRAGIEMQLTPHVLRHLHASLLVSQNIHPKVVSAQLGHTSPALTMSRYTHMLPDIHTGTGSAIEEALKLRRSSKASH